MNFILLLSLALNAVAVPTGDEIFKRATSQFCKKAKSGCSNAQENAGVQSYCSSYLSLPARKTKTFINLDTSTVYTGTSTTTMTTYLGGFSGSETGGARTSMLTVTAAGAPTTTITTTVSGATKWVYPSQCGNPSGTATAVAVARRDPVEARQAAVQPACFNKYAQKAQISSACSCFTLTATIPSTTLVESTTTLSIMSMVTTTSTVNGPQIVTSTMTISTVTSTSTVNTGPTVSAFALKNGAGGQYAASDADVMAFNFDVSNAGAFILNSAGNIIQGNGNYKGNAGWSNSAGVDYVRFGNPASYGVGNNYQNVVCSIQNVGGQCSLVCSANGWTQNCLYNYPNDSRNGDWILGTPGMSFCTDISAPLIRPLPGSFYQ